MRSRVVSLVLVLPLIAGGCDQVFGLDRSQDAGPDLSCKPLPDFASWTFSSVALSPPAALDAFSLLPADYVYASADALYETPDLRDQAAKIAFVAKPGSPHSNPRLSADGLLMIYEELLSAFESRVYLAQRTDMTTWTTTQMLQIPYNASGRSRPGPIVKVGAEYRLVVSLAGTLVELTSADLQVWTPLTTLQFSNHQVISGNDDLDPYLSPDGCWLVFSSNRVPSGNYDLWATSRRGTSESFALPTPVGGVAADPNLNAVDPSMSPDGASLWFIHDASTAGWQLVQGAPP